MKVLQNEKIYIEPWMEGIVSLKTFFFLLLDGQISEEAGLTISQYGKKYGKDLPLNCFQKAQCFRY